LFAWNVVLLVVNKLPGPRFAVEAAQLDRFGQMCALDAFGVFEIRDCPGHFQDAVIRPGG
jgi:hypothetical protein